MQPSSGRGPHADPRHIWTDAVVIETGGESRRGLFGAIQKRAPQRVEISNSQVVVYVTDTSGQNRDYPRDKIAALDGAGAPQAAAPRGSWVVKLASGVACAIVSTATLVMLAAYSPAREAEAEGFGLAAAASGEWRGRCDAPPSRRPIRLSIENDGAATRLVWSDFSYRLQPGLAGWTAYRGAQAVGQVRLEGERLIVEMSNFRCGRIVAERAA